MTSKPAIVIAGLGRCGSSLTMQMLQAGGIQCVGDWPDFEDDRSGFPLDRPWFENLRGVAVKRLDMHRDPTMPREAIVIWLSRNSDQQAKSMLKILRSQFSGVADNRQARKAMSAGIEKDTAKSTITIIGGTLPYIALGFEKLILEPAKTIAMMAVFLKFHGGYDLDREKAVSVIRPRSPDCLPGILEFDLLQERRI